MTIIEQAAHALNVPIAQIVKARLSEDGRIAALVDYGIAGTKRVYLIYLDAPAPEVPAAQIETRAYEVPTKKGKRK